MYFVNFMLEITPPSENISYHPKIGYGKNGGMYSFLYKDPIVKQYQETLVTEFTKQVKEMFLPPDEIVSSIVLFYVFGLAPDSYWERDLTNMIKATEDAILGKPRKKFTPLLPYDDAKVTVDMKRKIISDTDFVYIKVGLLTSLEESDIHVLLSMVSADMGYDYFHPTGRSESPQEELRDE